MTSPSLDELRTFILHRVDVELRAVGMAPEHVPDDFDLLTEGVIDSLGLLDLLTSLEDRYGIHTDFENLDVEELTVIGPLCRYIHARRTGPGDAP